MKLTIKQTLALDILEDKTTKELIFGGAAGGAKSVLGCYWLGKMCVKYPRSRWVMGRASLKTLKETTLNSFFWVMNELDFKVGRGYSFNAQSNIITFFNESQILLKDLYSYPSDPNFDELGSLEITGAFVDECNQVSARAWNILKSRIRYRLDEYGLIPKILGTCNPSKGWVYSDFYKPNEENKLSKDKCFIQALISDNPFISKHYYNNLLSLDKNSKMRLLYGDWSYDDDPAALIQYDNILNCFTNDFVGRTKGDRYISADIARLGRDRTVIGLWDGLTCFRIITLEKNKVDEAAELIKKLSHDYKVPRSNIIVDEDGVGGGVVDILGCKGFVNNSSALNDENYNNLKSQCYFTLARMVNANEIYIQTSETGVKDMIIEELEQVKQKDMDKDGKKAILPKDKVKEVLGRSPDFSDMLAMRIFYELNPVWDNAFF